MPEPNTLKFLDSSQCSENLKALGVIQENWRCYQSVTNCVYFCGVDTAGLRFKLSSPVIREHANMQRVDASLSCSMMKCNYLLLLRHANACDVPYVLNRLTH